MSTHCSQSPLLSRDTIVHVMALLAQWFPGATPTLVPCGVKGVIDHASVNVCGGWMGGHGGRSNTHDKTLLFWRKEGQVAQIVGSVCVGGRSCETD
jgi:hypothetical protein